MLHVYLSNLKISYTTEKNSVEREIAGLQTQIRENRELRKNLEQKNADSDYEAFSPRGGNSRNEERIVELDAEREKLQERLEAAEARQRDYEKKLAELEQAMSEEEGRENVSEQESVSKQKSAEQLTVVLSLKRRQPIVDRLKDVLRRTELCTHLMEMDSFRCKMELKNITESLNQILLELQASLSEDEQAIAKAADDET